MPPAFRLSGSGNLAFFSVSEVAKDNQHRIPFERDSNKDTLLWQIAGGIIRMIGLLVFGLISTRLDMSSRVLSFFANLRVGITQSQSD